MKSEQDTRVTDIPERSAQDEIVNKTRHLMSLRLPAAAIKYDVMYHALAVAEVAATYGLKCRVVGGSAEWDYGGMFFETRFNMYDVVPENELPKMHVWVECDKEVIDLTTRYVCERFGYARDYVYSPNYVWGVKKGRERYVGNQYATVAVNEVLMDKWAEFKDGRIKLEWDKWHMSIGGDDWRRSMKAK